MGVAGDAIAPALAMRGVRVRYRDRLALDLALLEIVSGERVAILGPNGAGKSTLLHVAGLLLDPETGDVLISGEAATARNRERLRRQAAIVLQQPALFRMSVLDNAALGLRLRGAGRREARAAAGAWLERFGIAHLADRRPATLSGGEAQRAALARAFAVEPRLLLLDEPFARLDVAARSALLPDLAGALAASGAAAVMVTHDLREGAAFGHRLGVLLDGKLAQIGPPGETLARPASLAAARVLGVENLVPGTATRDGAGWALRTPAGMISCGSAAPAVAEGAPCWLAVRAGAIRLEEAATGCHVRCRIVSAEIAPDGWRVTLDGDLQLTAHPGWDREPPQAGAEAAVTIPRDRAHLVAG